MTGPVGVTTRPHRLALRFFSVTWCDFVAAIESVATGGGKSWLVFAIAFVATWFVYVPIHELLHAYGCLVAGGDVTRLEIAPEYGGALLAQVFPFVVAGSAYAGQLTGFDTHGSDAVYLATVLAPYLLTIVAGVPLLRRAAATGASPLVNAGRAGVALPLAAAPFLALAGDYYEAGSIVSTRLAREAGWLLDPARLRSDDLVKLVATLRANDTGPSDWTLVGASFVAGCALAFGTYHLGALVAHHRGARRDARAIMEKRK